MAGILEMLSVKGILDLSKTAATHIKDWDIMLGTDEVGASLIEKWNHSVMSDSLWPHGL